MSNHNDKPITRRQALTGITVAGIASTSGCVGQFTDDDEDLRPDDDYPDLPHISEIESPAEDVEYPQPLNRVLEEGYVYISSDQLEAMPTQDEPYYGDPTPEFPQPEEDWIDPDPIVFAEGTGDETPATLPDAFDPLIERYEEVFDDRDVEFFEVTDYVAAVEAMRADRLHITRYGTGTVSTAVNLAGAIPRYIPIDEDDQFGNRNYFVTRKDSGIDTVDDIRGRDDIVHTHETSGSGHLTPEAIYSEELDLVPGEDYEYEFSGGHTDSHRGIEAGDWGGGPTCSWCIGDNVDDETIDGDVFQVVYIGEPAAPTSYSINSNLHPDIVEKLDEIYLETDFSGTRYAEELGGARFVEADYATHYHSQLQIDAHNEVEYGEELD